MDGLGKFAVLLSLPWLLNGGGDASVNVPNPFALVRCVRPSGILIHYPSR